MLAQHHFQSNTLTACIYILLCLFLTVNFQLSNMTSTNNQPTPNSSYKSYITTVYSLQCYQLISTYQYHAKTCTLSAARTGFIRHCIRSNLLPNFAKININPQDRRGARAIYRLQCSYMRTCLSSQMAIKNKNYMLKIKVFNQLTSILSQYDATTLKTITNNMCNSMWTSLNRNLIKKSDFLSNKGQYTYNILNEHPKNPTKKLQTNLLLQKIKCCIPHVSNEINKPCYHNLTNYNFTQQYQTGKHYFNQCRQGWLQCYHRKNGLYQTG